jgi:hypothetical protein
MRAGRVNVIGILIVLALVVGAVFLHTFGPYYWDAFAMGEVVKNAAITCQDRDEDKGKERLTQELYQRDIPDYIVESDCRIDRRGDTCTVKCAWTVSVEWPLTDVARVMSFEQHATRGPAGFKD